MQAAALPAQPQHVGYVAVAQVQHRGTVGGLTNGQHLMHLVLTVLTLGLWAPIWAIMAWAGRRRVAIR